MMKLQNHTISPNSPPFIIAEISANHNQSLERALKIVEAAAHAGAHAIKLQTYTPDTMTLDINKGEFVITDEKSLRPFLIRFVQRSSYSMGMAQAHF
jgi:N-acetylneuraminate synthase